MKSSCCTGPPTARRSPSATRRTYPSHVEALVLDSVVPPNGPDPLEPRDVRRRAARSALSCAPGAHVRAHHAQPAERPRQGRRTQQPPRAARTLDRRRRPRAHGLPISSEELLEILLQGDLEPTLRAEFPAAVRSAAHGDNAPLARLLEHAQSAAKAKTKPKAPRASTRRSTTRRPAKRGVSLGTAELRRRRASRRRERRSRRCRPARSRPFTAARRARAQRHPGVRLLAILTPAPPPAQWSRSRRCPTLILSGADDLRTPTANAREVAAQIPGSHLLVVPNVGPLGARQRSQRLPDRRAAGAVRAHPDQAVHGHAACRRPCSR